MKFTADQLLVFAAVVDHRSLSAAARSLSVTQPAVSARLRSLETLVGERLYSANRAGVTLTPAGEALLPHARAIAHAMARAGHALTDAADREHRVTIAVAEAAVPLVIPRIAAEALGTPPLALDLLPCDAATAVRKVVAGEAEVAVSVAPPAAPGDGLIRRPLLVDEIVLVHTGGLPQFAPIEVVAELTVLWQAAGSGVRATAQSALEAAGVWPRRAIELGSSPGVLAAIVAGHGAGFLNRRYAETYASAGLVRLTGLDTTDLYARFELVSPPVEQLSSGARRVFGALQRS